jgi:hypothetical protein
MISAVYLVRAIKIHALCEPGYVITCVANFTEENCLTHPPVHTRNMLTTEQSSFVMTMQCSTLLTDNDDALSHSRRNISTCCYERGITESLSTGASSGSMMPADDNEDDR